VRTDQTGNVVDLPRSGGQRVATPNRAITLIAWDTSAPKVNWRILTAGGGSAEADAEFGPVVSPTAIGDPTSTAPMPAGCSPE
jgi:hypothetical protein